MAKLIELQQLIMENALYSTPERIKTDIMLGNIQIDGVSATSAKQKVRRGCTIFIRDYYKRYVSRGGYKLEHAIKVFDIRMDGRTAIDCGASMGGFTDCLLQHGAAKVYAVEAGYGQLAGKLRQDERVVNLEQTNISDLSRAGLSPAPTAASIDIGYLSLAKAIPIFVDLMNETWYDLICLLKPIYETENHVKRRTGEHLTAQESRVVIKQTAEFIKSAGLKLRGITHSPVTGSGGLREYLLHVSSGGECMNDCEIDKKINAAIDAAFTLSKDELQFDYYGVLN